jgi:hypothetical protein
MKSQKDSGIKKKNEINGLKTEDRKPVVKLNSTEE